MKNCPTHHPLLTTSLTHIMMTCLMKNRLTHHPLLTTSLTHIRGIQNHNTPSTTHPPIMPRLQTTPVNLAIMTLPQAIITNTLQLLQTTGILLLLPTLTLTPLLASHMAILLIPTNPISVMTLILLFSFPLGCSCATLCKGNRTMSSTWSATVTSTSMLCLCQTRNEKKSLGLEDWASFPTRAMVAMWPLYLSQPRTAPWQLPAISELVETAFWRRYQWKPSTSLP